jgi:C4-type Zn-finger protein
MSVNEPPLPINPILLAGTWNEYSTSAIIHENSTTPYSGQLVIDPVCCNFRCPYHAKVIKILETTKSKMVYRAFIK